MHRKDTWDNELLGVERQELQSLQLLVLRCPLMPQSTELALPEMNHCIEVFLCQEVLLGS